MAFRCIYSSKKLRTFNFLNAGLPAERRQGCDPVPLDIRKKKFYWMGQIEGVEGCFGALATKDHTVYFSSFGHLYKDNKLVTDKNGKAVTRPYLVRYDPPKDLESLKN